MSGKLSVGVIGDFDADSPSHEATVKSLEHAAGLLDTSVEVKWMPTPSLEKQVPGVCSGFDALWCAPGTVESLDGALEGIRFAREKRVPFLGTCGGFQNVVVEFARNVLGHAEASHEEHAPGSKTPFVSPLACSLVGTKSRVGISSGSLAEGIYGTRESEEEYRCTYGITSGRRKLLEEGGLRVSGVDETGEPRILELPDHPFYIATLFVPQMNSSAEEPHPLVVRLLRTAIDRSEWSGSVES